MELVGHADIAARFFNALQQGRLHHAWLLYGAAGIGKHTLARELAAGFLCEQQLQRACGNCHGCRMFMAGSHPDLFQVSRQEGKRDISIAQIRELLAFLTLSGAEGERRVVILDGGEYMNMQAANALLKGLEEPAAGSLLLMTCSDLMRLPATIRSRCLLQHCAPLAEEDVRRVLGTLAVEEKYMTLAVALADGCPGTVACLQEKDVAEALLDWQRLTEDLAAADVGAIQDWLQRHIARVPHRLIADVLLMGIRGSLQRRAGFADTERLLTAAWALAGWPQAVARQTLRPAPTLLAHILRLRMAMRSRDASLAVKAG